MGMMAMGFGFGIALGPLLAGAVAIYSFELPFLLGGLLCLVGAFIVYRFVPETVSRARDSRSRRQALPAAERSEHRA